MDVYKRHLETELPPHPAGGGAQGSGRLPFPENAGLFVGAGLVVASEQTPSRASAARKIRSFIRISLGGELSPRKYQIWNDLFRERNSAAVIGIKPNGGTAKGV
jgi:hypothetical protein